VQGPDVPALAFALRANDDQSTNERAVLSCGQKRKRQEDKPSRDDQRGDRPGGYVDFFPCGGSAHFNTSLGRSGDIGAGHASDVTGVTAPVPATAHAAPHQDWPQRPSCERQEVSMSKFVIGERVDHGAHDRRGGTVVAVFPTVDGKFRYAVDMEGYGALQFFNEERLVLHLH
jgi:hypothetical protein